MSQDPSGTSSPFGDNAEFPESSSPESFGADAFAAGDSLDLKEGSTESAEAVPAATVHEGPKLSSPSAADLQFLTVKEPSESDAPGAPQDDGQLDPLDQFAVDGDLSALEALGDEGLEDFGEIEDYGTDLEGFADENEEVEDGDSWLMEFDSSADAEESEPEFAEAVQAAPTRSIWLGRALIATFSVALGMLGSRYLMGDGLNQGENPVQPRVAKVDPAPTQPGSETPEVPAAASGEGTDVVSGAGAEGTDPQPVAPKNPSNPNSKTSKAVGIATTSGGRPKPVTKTGPAGESGSSQVAGGAPSPTPVMTSPGGESTQTPVALGPISQNPSQPSISVDLQGPQPGRERRVQEVPLEDMLQLPTESETGLRRASDAELASVWPGKTIPVDAIRGSKRLMTPAVGRVRVVLASGEAFEGKLYAVGKRRVWIETKTGKLALLDYQIDHVEHIVGADGGSLEGGDSSSDLSGLRGVRVRTAGGVFYGKLLSQQGDTVTIVTDSGARITLKDAQVEAAGRAATHLVNSSGAQEAVEEEGTP